MTLLATIIALGPLIFVHELGHFLAAKAVGVHVERFSIGLGPRVFGFRWGATEYVLSAIPLGGYVKMGGMEDEVMERIEGGAEAPPRVPGPGDFDGKPVWARTVIISAGVVMNMIFAFAAYTFIVAYWGVQEVDSTRVGQVRAELLPAGTEALADVAPGSRIVRVGGAEVAHWGNVMDALVESAPGPLALEFAEPGVTIEVDLPGDPAERGRLARAVPFWREALVGAVEPGSPAERGGLEAGDRILALDGTPVRMWEDFERYVQRHPEQRVEFTVVRDGRQLMRVVTPESRQVRDESGTARDVGQVGVYTPQPPTTYARVSFGEAVATGYEQTVAVTRLTVDFLRRLVTMDVSPRNVGSIVAIGAASGQAIRQGVDVFLGLMALLSVNLAVLNILPIPVLDGGHLVFLGIEAVRGRALSVEQRLRWSNVGLIIIMGLMVFALSNDFLRLLGL